jgi:hypothetical protein
MDPESAYRQLGQLIAEAPDLEVSQPYPPDTFRWLGRVAAVVEQVSKDSDNALLKAAIDGLGSMARRTNAHTVMAVLHRALARAELQAPAAAQGAFIPVGAQFDVFQAIGKVFQGAKRDLLVVDPYLDQVVLTQFAALAAEGIKLRLLGDVLRRDCGDRLRIAMDAWKAQYGAKRPVEARRAPARSLHDRLILVDGGAEAWSIGQSIKDIAKHSPTAFIRLPAEVLPEKAEAYEAIWKDAVPLT